MNISTVFVRIAGLTLALACAVHADVRLPAVIGDNMVLQQREKVRIWGWAAPGEVVSVEAGWGRSAKTRASTDSTWEVRIKTPTAGGPFELTIRGANTVVVRNVLIGEVWFCSGQSNMFWTLRRIEAQADIDAASLPQIRLFHVPRNAAPGQRRM